MIKIVALCCVMLASLLPLSAHSKYPEKPIRLVVPYPAGGTTDVLARLVARNMSVILGQQVIVDNKAGAATIVGVEAVSKANNDGYTILLSTATSFAVNPHIYKKLPYQLDEFVQIGFIAEAPIVLVSPLSFAPKNLGELIALLKASKDETPVATTGKGGFSHLTAAMFFNAINARFRDVPYKGEAPAIQDLLGAQVNLYFGSLPGTLPHVTSGRFRAYAVTSVARSPSAPAIPSFTESGIPEVVATSWFGLAAPKGTPAEAVGVLADALKKAIEDKDVQARLFTDGAVSRYLKPEEFADYIKRDNERWGRIVRAAKFEAD